MMNKLSFLAKLNKDVPINVIKILAHIVKRCITINMKDVDYTTVTIPDHPLFKNPVWEYMINIQDPECNSHIVENPTGEWTLVFTSIGNFEEFQTHELFLNWLEPYMKEIKGEIENSRYDYLITKKDDKLFFYMGKCDGEEPEISEFSESIKSEIINASKAYPIEIGSILERDRENTIIDVVITDYFKKYDFIILLHEISKQIGLGAIDKIPCGFATIEFFSSFKHTYYLSNNIATLKCNISYDRTSVKMIFPNKKEI